MCDVLERARAGRALATLTVLAAVMLLATALASSAAAQPDDPPTDPPGPPSALTATAGSSDWEVWALDQGDGVNRVYVYDAELEPRTVIELEPHGVETPHMIEFSSTNEYAVVASTSSGNVTIIRTADYEVVEIIETGAGAHMAHFTPDDTSIWVANIGTATFTEITADLDTETFALGRELDVTEDPAWAEEFAEVPGGGGGARDLNVPAPVCHEYTADGQFAYLTLGPGPGGLVVVDIDADEPEIVTAFPRDDDGDEPGVRANCGLARSADGAKMYANWGDPGDPDDPPEQSGEWYVFDTSDHSLLQASEETRGIDAHGVRITPDGSELWQVNRGTSDGIVVDTDTDTIIDDLEDTGDSPDILDFSPDGELAFVSLRGPNPLSGAAHVATGSTPGFSVIDVDSREQVDLIQPGEDEFGDLGEDDPRDFHGLGVRGPRDVSRLAGLGRIETAVSISRNLFGDGAADGAVIARADDFADALAGTPLAAAVGGPLLLTPSHELPDAVADELLRAVPETATVTVLGGTAAISAEVEQEIVDLGFAGVDRVSGSTRFETAVAIAGELDDPNLHLLTTGIDFPDALTAGTAAAANDGAVLLTAGADAHGATQAYLDANEGTRHAIGGPAAEAHPDAEAHVGTTRFETAGEVAAAFFDEPPAAGLARGDVFADALAGGVHAAAHGGPVLLSPSTSLHQVASGYVCGRDSVERAFGYGGTAALSSDVLHALRERLHGDGC